MKDQAFEAAVLQVAKEHGYAYMDKVLAKRDGHYLTLWVDSMRIGWDAAQAACDKTMVVVAEIDQQGRLKILNHSALDYGTKLYACSIAALQPDGDAHLCPTCQRYNKTCPLDGFDTVTACVEYRPTVPQPDGVGDGGEMDDANFIALENLANCQACNAPAGSGEACKKCGQIDIGQYGEYPCPKCGLPTLHEAQQPAPDGEAVACKFFAYEPDNGFETYNTKAEAKQAAQDSIDSYREDAADGWPDEVENVYWGVVLGTTKQVPVPDDGYDGSHGIADSGPFVDYVLTEHVSPAPVNQLVDLLRQAREDMRSANYSTAAIRLEAALAAAGKE
ncbi:hypothetical protein EAY64_06405 [Aquitalea palustris]|uniref:Uncharacterized protein n=1 Tax=Aquitalea palustris TaxID=2480983 RepID=A0A454JKU2_9NEIS|nr:hypothetical protein [Aquitalea palustris]RMC99933.1 hypothetical protein EAY64_06405 [Aquitalea palustris]